MDKPLWLARHEAPCVAASTRRSLRLPLLSRAIAVAQNARHGVSPRMPPAHQISRKNVPGSLLQPSSNTLTADIHGVVFRSPGSVVRLGNSAVFTTRAVLSGKFRAVCYSSGWKKETSGILRGTTGTVSGPDQENAREHDMSLGISGRSQVGVLSVPGSRSDPAHPGRSGVCEISISRLVKS